MGEDSRFAGRGGKPKRQKRKAPEKIEETDVVVRCNGRVSAPENTVLVSLHKLEDYSLEGILAHVGNKLFDRPAAGLYHEDGIAVASLTLLKEGETIYAAANEDEIYVGCIADNASTLHTASTAEVSEIELAEKGMSNAYYQKAEIFLWGGGGGVRPPLGGFSDVSRGGWRKKKSGGRKIYRGGGPACTHTRHGAIFSLVPREQSAARTRLN